MPDEGQAPKEVLSVGQAELIERLWEIYPKVADDDFVKEFLASEG